MWHRNAAKKEKEKEKAKAAEETPAPQEQRFVSLTVLGEANNVYSRGSQVLVIHPGSRFIRIGRASDVNPVSVPNVLARRTSVSTPPTFVEGISRPRTGRQLNHHVNENGDDDYTAVPLSDDPVSLR